MSRDRIYSVTTTQLVTRTYLVQAPDEETAALHGPMTQPMDTKYTDERVEKVEEEE